MVVRGEIRDRSEQEWARLVCLGARDRRGNPGETLGLSEHVPSNAVHGISRTPANAIRISRKPVHAEHAGTVARAVSGRDRSFARGEHGPSRAKCHSWRPGAWARVTGFFERV